VRGGKSDDELFNSQLSKTLPSFDILQLERGSETELITIYQAKTHQKQFAENLGKTKCD
jgi:hypothetical protein